VDKRVILYVDGACRGNPGPGAIGVVIQNSKGHTILQTSRYIGDTTNNKAEYRALIAALEEAARLGAQHLDIKTDSELLARQLQQTYRVKSATLRPLYQQAKELLTKFKSFGITHIPRENNTVADRLANEALDNSTPRSRPSRT
jgi:ribonuclease HI